MGNGKWELAWVTALGNLVTLFTNFITFRKKMGLILIKTSQLSILKSGKI